MESVFSSPYPSRGWKPRTSAHEKDRGVCQKDDSTSVGEGGEPLATNLTNLELTDGLCQLTFNLMELVKELVSVV